MVKRSQPRARNHNPQVQTSSRPAATRIKGANAQALLPSSRLSCLATYTGLPGLAAPLQRYVYTVHHAPSNTPGRSSLSLTVPPSLLRRLSRLHRPHLRTLHNIPFIPRHYAIPHFRHPPPRPFLLAASTSHRSVTIIRSSSHQPWTTTNTTCCLGRRGHRWCSLSTDCITLKGPIGPLSIAASIPERPAH